MLKITAIDVSNPAIHAAWEKVKSETDNTNWVLLTSPDAEKVEVVATGSDGFAGMKKHFKDDIALYGGFSASVTGLPILFQFFFQGDDMNPIKRGKTRMVKLGVFSALDGALGEVIIEGLAEATKENVYEQIDFASGGVGVSEISF